MGRKEGSLLKEKEYTGEREETTSSVKRWNGALIKSGSNSPFGLGNISRGDMDASGSSKVLADHCRMNQCLQWYQVPGNCINPLSSEG